MSDSANSYGLMSYCTASGSCRAGLVVKGEVFDVRDAFVDTDLTLYRDFDVTSAMSLLQNWERAEPVINDFVAQIAKQNLHGASFESIDLEAPLTYPGTVYCVGANYRDHVAEMARVNNMALESDPKSKGIEPWFFIKPSRACVVASGADVKRPEGCKKLDWEVELVAVIGKKARHVSAGDALDYVAGYTIANDLSARDMFRRPRVAAGSPFHHDWLAHKGFEGSCPLGPWITPASQVADPQNLSLKLWVNDVIKQDSNTSEMIFSVAEQIAHLSSAVTLYPGDIVLTGTPAGVGSARGEFLNPGDTVRIEIEGLGALHTHIV